MWSNGLKKLQTSIKNLKHFKARFKARDFALMQIAIAKNHTLKSKLGTHCPRTQSPKKVNLDNNKSSNNQSNNKERLRPDRLRNSTWAQATTRNTVLQKSGKKLKKAFSKALLGVETSRKLRQSLQLSDPFKANFKARFFGQGLLALHWENWVNATTATDSLVYVETQYFSDAFSFST